jgi:DNA-binding transcriptional MerR regulator
MAEYRVDELAAEVGITVELLRSYQSKGLLPAPDHRGRVAYYDDRHLERLRAILDLKHQGYSLRMIANLLEHPVPGPATLADTLGEPEEEPFDLRELARRTRVPPAMLRSLEAGDGLPIEEFLRVARTQIAAAEEVAAGAVELFLEYVREPLLERKLSRKDEAEQLVAAFGMLLQATSTLISYNFQRLVINGLEDELERLGAKTELATLHKESRRRRLEVLPA